MHTFTTKPTENHSAFEDYSAFFNDSLLTDGLVGKGRRQIFGDDSKQSHIHSCRWPNQSWTGYLRYTGMHLCDLCDYMKYQPSFSFVLLMDIPLLITIFLVNQCLIWHILFQTIEMNLAYHYYLTIAIIHQ